MPLPLQFHPAVRAWFDRRFDDPTPAQSRGWAEILAGRDTLIAAPTGSGKTLAAFLASVDALVRRGDAPLRRARRRRASSSRSSTSRPSRR